MTGRIDELHCRDVRCSVGIGLLGDPGITSVRSLVLLACDGRRVAQATGSASQKGRLGLWQQQLQLRLRLYDRSFGWIVVRAEQGQLEEEGGSMTAAGGSHAHDALATKYI